MTQQVKPWEVLESRDVLAIAPWLRIRVERVRLPSGRTVDDFWQIDLPDFVVVVAQTEGGEIVLERQYKHGARRITLMLPSGTLESGEDPLKGAQRELLEETGYSADHWEPLGSFVVDANRGRGTAHCFLARSARRVALPRADDLEPLEVVLTKPHQVLQAIRRGEVVLLSSVAAVALALNPLLLPGGTLTNGDKG